MGKKVLIADDHKKLRDLIEMTLSGFNHRIIQAEDGAEALKKARKEKPDLMVLDVNMPKMNGFEVCRALKSDRSTAKIKVVILTAQDKDAARRMGKAAGADYYCTKPFSPTAFLNRVSSILQ